MSRDSIIGVAPLAFPWQTKDPFLVCVHHVDLYPRGNDRLGPAASLDGRDIFAWRDPPTLARYLEAGPDAWIATRVEGTWHNLFSVLIALGVPASLIGLAGLPWVVRVRAVQPIALVAGLTFITTSLLFPVATTWGTFHHAAVPAHVLLVMSCLLALDATLAWVGARLGWHRPVAWLAAVLGVFSGLLFTFALVPSFGDGSRATQAIA